MRDRAGFVSTVSDRLQRALKSRPYTMELPTWLTPSSDLTDLGNQLRELYDRGLRVVVCLDEFEELLENRDAFNNAFYDAMRALLDAQHLMLVIASTRPLTYYGQRYQLVSRFFNLTNSLVLDELTEDEAQTLLTRPATFGETRSALGAMDSQLALRLGGHHPFFLQMAAYYVFEAQVLGHDETWIQHQFEAQAYQHYSGWRRHQRMVLRGLLRGPAWLGRVVVSVGIRQDDVANVMVGFAVIVVVILTLLGWLPVVPLWTWLKGLLGLGAGS